MKNSRKIKLRHSFTTQKQVERALSILRILHFELGLSQRTYSEIESLLNSYYEKSPDSSIKPSTLVGCITYLVSLMNNEHISIASIADKIGVSSSYLSKKKKSIATFLNL
ncbi:MAG: cyclin family protein [Candidatus Hodarchaeales archaeon]